MRYLLFLMFCALPGTLLSQGTAAVRPQVTVDAPNEDVVVGQPAIVRIKVLVPTFMPSPPVFPSMEQENLLIRLPERASGPVSEAVEGETWSGVQRSYRIYPLTSGLIEFGDTDMSVTFTDPDTNEPVQVSVPLPPISINAVIPDGARDLNPLIIATGFEVIQEIEGPTKMQAGDAITRRLTAKIAGTSPLLIPPLLLEPSTSLLRPYPKETRITETEDRGILSGQRVDEVVYIAQDGGQTQLPPISVQWYNLETNTVETVDVAAVDLQLAAPISPPPDFETMARYMIWSVLIGIAALAGLRWLAPRLQAWREARAEAYRASPAYALAQLRQALRDNDLSKAYAWLETWKRRCMDPTGYTDLEALLAKIGATRYALDSEGKSPDWAGAVAAVNALMNAPEKHAQPLPPLNP